MRRSFDLALSCMDVASRQEYETIAANRERRRLAHLPPAATIGTFALAEPPWLS
jgi:hypothetical protein